MSQTLTRIPIRMEMTERAPGEFEGVILAQGKSLNPAFFTESSIESGRRVFLGAKMFKNHPSAMDEYNQPERNIEHIIGEVRETDVRMVDGKQVLWGVYYISEAESSIRTKIAERLITDVSINAHANATFDEAQGFWIVESFTDPDTEGILPPTVDIVTWGAAGGTINTRQSFKMSIIQDTVIADENEPSIEEDESMKPKTEVATPDETPTINNDLVVMEARFARSLETNTTLLELSQTVAHLPAPTQARIVANARSLVTAYIYEGGTLTDLQAKLSKAVDDEKTYLESVAPAGIPRGASGITDRPAPTDQRLIQAIEATYDNLYSL